MSKVFTVKGPIISLLNFLVSALDGSRGAEKNKKEKRPAWEKIVGGWDIKNEHDWPWMVSFGRQCEGWNGPTCNGEWNPLEGGKGTGHICGGSLIWDGQYVVTAAHCLGKFSRITAF